MKSSCAYTKAARLAFLGVRGCLLRNSRILNLKFPKLEFLKLEFLILNSLRILAQFFIGWLSPAGRRLVWFFTAATANSRIL